MSSPPETILQYEDKTYCFHGHPSGDRAYGAIEKTGAFHDLETLEFIRSRRLSGTYIDIGAHLGNDALFFLTATDCGQLIALEGNHELASICRSNIEPYLPAGKTFRLENRFISDQSELFFNPDIENNMGASFLSRVRISEDSIPVKPTGLCRIVSEKNPVALIKVDVEGHEMEALRSATPILRHRSPEICVATGLTPVDLLMPYLMNFHYLPIASLPGGNVYFVKFPSLAIAVVRLACGLPKSIARRSVWRLIRFLAVCFGMLPFNQRKKYVPKGEISYPECD